MNIYQDSQRPIQERVADLLSKMTVKEKVGQVNQRLYGWQTIEKGNDEDYRITNVLKDEVKKYGGVGALYGVLRADPWSGRNHQNGIHKSQSKRVLRLIQDYVVSHSRLGIPVLFSEESSHGHQALDSVVFPSNLARAASWNESLQHEMFHSLGEEMMQKGVQLGLISVFDILRDPRWGRAEECYGEDPYLAARMATQAIDGFHTESTALVAKHFCAQGVTTAGHNGSPANIGRRELMEIHSFGIEYVLKHAQLEAVMAAYNEIDGVLCHGNRWLLTDYLRTQLGYNGIVMADGTGIDRLDKMTGDHQRSATLALEAGVDLSLWDDAYTQLVNLVEQTPALEPLLDRAVARVLRLKFEKGLFDHRQEPSVPVRGLQELEDDQRKIARRAAEESMVLLKNDGILPLQFDRYQSIAVIGPNAASQYALLGDYVADQLQNPNQTILGALRQTELGPKLKYAKGCDILEASEAALKEAVAVANQSDLVILVVGGSSERNFEMKFLGNGAVTSRGANMDSGENVDIGDIRLSKAQRALVRAVAVVGKPIVTILVEGRPYAINEVVDVSKAVLDAWFPGQEGGTAVANILLGKVNPSGKLPVSIPDNPFQLPVAYNRRFSNAKENYTDVSGLPRFSFGFGLSYSSFKYQKLSIARPELSIAELQSGQQFELRIRIENTSAVAGKETIEVYIKPQGGSVVPRIRELKGFQKLLIAAHSEAESTIRLGVDELLTVNQAGQRKLEPGALKVIIGTGTETYLEDQIMIVP